MFQTGNILQRWVLESVTIELPPRPTFRDIAPGHNYVSGDFVGVTPATVQQKISQKDDGRSGKWLEMRLFREHPTLI